MIRRISHQEFGGMNSFRMVVRRRPRQDRRHGGGAARGGEIGQVCLRHGGGAAGGGEIDFSMEQLAKYVPAVADPSAVSEAPAVAYAPRGCGCRRSRGLAKQLVIPPLLPPPIDDPPSHEPAVEDVAAADADVEAMPARIVDRATIVKQARVCIGVFGFVAFRCARRRRLIACLVEGEIDIMIAFAPQLVIPTFEFHLIS
jgi:hypothetical protein